MLNVLHVLNAIHVHPQSPLFHYYQTNLPMPSLLPLPILPAWLVLGQLRTVLRPNFPLLILIAYHQLQRYPKVTELQHRASLRPLHRNTHLLLSPYLNHMSFPHQYQALACLQMSSRIFL